MTDNVDDVRRCIACWTEQNLGDVRNVAWDKTKEKTKKTLEEKSDELVKTVINYALGTFSLGLHRRRRIPADGQDGDAGHRCLEPEV